MNDNEHDRIDPMLLNFLENDIVINTNSERLSPNNFDLKSEHLLNNAFSVSHLNIRSLFKNFDSLQELYIDTFKNKFDIIGLSEVWSVKDIDQFKIPDYNLELQLRENQRGGGVGAYIHSSLNYSRIQNLSLVHAESIWFKVLIDNTSIIVGVIYRKPGTNLDEFKDGLNSVLQNLNLDRNLSIILGDFNIDLNSNDEKSKELLRLAETYGLLQLIKTATRITNTSSTLIDHIYTNISSYEIQSGCIEAGISDHLPVYVLFKNFNCVSATKTTKHLRNFRNFSKDSFLNDLSNLSWNEIYSSNNSNDAYELFYTSFIDVCNKHAPIEETTFSRKKRDNPWITKSIKRSIRKKHVLYSKMIRSEHNKYYVDKYKRYRNTLTSVLRTAKKLYYGTLFERDKSNSKKTWDHINELLNKKCTSQNITKIHELVKTDGSKVTSPNDIADTFNNFFVSVGENLANKIVTTDDSFKRYLSPNQDSSLFFLPVTNSDVNEVLCTLDKSKASGYDDLPVRLLVDAKEYVSEPLTYILNLSLTTGVFPDKLKIARVIPIFKKGDKDKPGNYRPISILPVVSKLFEKLVNMRLVNFLEKNDILYKHQYGFRQGYNTKLSLINLINQITKNTDEGRMTIGVFIDFAKAFDTINHTILLKKLENYGIRGIALEWFRNYLKGRQQFVDYGDCKSTEKPITCGVPQGSVLGPTLFLIYINDLPNSSKYFNFRLFADDSNLFHSFQPGENIIDLTDISQKFKDVIAWCNANRLTINVGKTKYILFRGRRKKFELFGNLLVNESILESVESTSFLGINIDEHLTWKKHINCVCSVLSKRIGILYRLRHFVYRKILIMLYNTFILPHITYGLEVWGAALKTFMNPIIMIQKRMARIITFKGYRHHSDPLFFELKLLDVFKKYRYLIGIFMYDLLNENLPHRIFEYCSYIDHMYSTRNKENFNLKNEIIRTNLGKQSLSYSGPVIWNSLPTDLRITTSRKQFCKKYKKYLLEEYNQ